MERLEQVMQRIDKFNKDRDWDKFHSPSNLSKSISIEANELLECFQWNDYEYASLFSLAGNGFDTLAGVIVQNRFYGSVNVYGLIIMIPLLVLYIIVQNKFIDSVEKVAIIG